MSPSKEPGFLADDFSHPSYPKSEQEYLALFAGATGERWLGEATTTYLLSEKAADRIAEFSPGGKAIAVLRNPVDLLFSLHGQRVKEGAEDEWDFRKALDLEPERREGRLLPPGYQYPKEYLCYTDFGRYHDQLQRFFCALGRDSVMVLLLDDFKRDSKEVFAKVCEFLEISADVPIDFAIQNERGAVNPIWVKRVIQFGAKPSVQRFFPWRLRRMVRESLVARTSKALPSRMSDETRETLIEIYREEIAAVSGLIGRDLIREWGFSP